MLCKVSVLKPYQSSIKELAVPEDVWRVQSAQHPPLGGKVGVEQLVEGGATGGGSRATLGQLSQQLQHTEGRCTGSLLVCYPLPPQLTLSGRAHLPQPCSELWPAWPTALPQAAAGRWSGGEGGGQPHHRWTETG